MHGYLSSEYALSLAEFGTPRQLPDSGGWIIERSIPGFPDRDAMGGYPLFCCDGWNHLTDDFDGLKDSLVSIALVADPFGGYDLDELSQSFEVVKHFKDHLVADLTQRLEKAASRHHRYYARRSLRTARVELCTAPLQHLDEWGRLYQVLVRRHDLKGIKAFSRTSFARQLQTPGLVMFRMMRGDSTIAAQLWFVQGEVAYNHLTAVDDEGYSIRASYGLYWEAMHALATRFRGQLRWLDLGAGAGVSENEDGGLTVFKRGWATGTRPAYFCGRVLNRARYDEIVRACGVRETAYFPAYRDGEFKTETNEDFSRKLATPHFFDRIESPSFSVRQT